MNAHVPLPGAAAALLPPLDMAVEEGFDFLSPAYRDLFARSAATAFQAPLWMHVLHRDLVPALGASAHTIVLRERGSGQLFAVIPLVRQRQGVLTLLQPADLGVCDYNAPVAPLAVLEALAGDPQALERLGRLLDPAGILLFRKVRADGFDPARLFPGARCSAGENPAFHAALPDDFEDWRRREMRKKFSKELNRLARQLERDVGPYEHREVRDEASIREAFAFARAARQGRFEDDLFDREAYHRFYLAYALEGAASGESVTFVSFLAGKPVAMLFGPAGDGVFHAVVIASASNELQKFSPGSQVLYQMIRQRHEAGHRLFDMGLGNSGYKSHFRVEETAMHNVTLARGLAGQAAALVYNHAKPVKNMIRRLAPALR